MKSRSKSQPAVFLHRRLFSPEHWDALSATPDAPEEATQRPPFLALRGPSHSHPAALLHRRLFSPEHWDALSATPDAPEEATQRPPFLALRGPSHSHPAALLHRRRRITPWQASSPASSAPFRPLPGRGGIGRGPR